MTVLEIVLLVLGCALFVGSYFAPISKKELQEETKQLAKDEVKELIADEVKTLRQEMQTQADQIAEDAVEKAKRSMERISNEKIMAVNEYSDTVLEEINKNHKEVVFLYDMLTDKQVTIKETVEEAQKEMGELLQKIKDAEPVAPAPAPAAEVPVAVPLPRNNAEHGILSAPSAAEEKKTEPVSAFATSTVKRDTEVPGTDMAMEIPTFMTKIPSLQTPPPTVPSAAVPVPAEVPVTVSEPVEEEPKPEFTPFVPEKVTAVPKRTRKTTKKAKPQEEEKTQKTPEESGKKKPENSDMTLQFAPSKIPGTSSEQGMNNNERILELHRAGKSNMAIAKQLGLGIGEVKLVIDLYK